MQSFKILYPFNPYLLSFSVDPEDWCCLTKIMGIKFTLFCRPVSLSVSRDPTHIAKISVTSPIVINMPTRELLEGKTKSSFV